MHVSFDAIDSWFMVSSRIKRLKSVYNILFKVIVGKVGHKGTRVLHIFRVLEDFDDIVPKDDLLP